MLAFARHYGGTTKGRIKTKVNDKCIFKDETMNDVMIMCMLHLTYILEWICQPFPFECEVHGSVTIRVLGKSALLSIG